MLPILSGATSARTTTRLPFSRYRLIYRHFLDQGLMNCRALHLVRLVAAGLRRVRVSDQDHPIRHVVERPELKPCRQRLPTLLQGLNRTTGIVRVAPLDADHLTD